MIIPTYSIDTRGKPCPLPVVMMKNKITSMKEGEVLEVITSEIVAKDNIERFCKKKYEVVCIVEETELFKIYIRK